MLMAKGCCCIESALLLAMEGVDFRPFLDMLSSHSLPESQETASTIYTPTNVDVVDGVASHTFTYQIYLYDVVEAGLQGDDYLPTHSML